jgi:hypothetical protein
MRLVACHDAGGAELVSSWLRRNGSDDCLFLLQGPALGIFERKLGALPMVCLDEGLARATSLLCGTSWQSMLELEAIDAARARRIRSVAFLDHWVNYRERFGRSSHLRMPDELWVADDAAFRLAMSEFPGTPITVVGNPYFEDLRSELATLPPVAPPGAPLDVLYICEPAGDFGHMALEVSTIGYDEHEALRFFLQRLHRLGAPVRRVVVRPHPSEPSGKYDWAVDFCGLPVRIGGKASLVDEIAASDVVAGVESMALVIGLLAGRRVISAIPPDGRPCVLPLPGIEFLRA